MDLDSACQEMKKAVAEATKKANAIVTGLNRDVDLSVDSNQLNKVMRIKAANALDLMSRLMSREQSGTRSVDKIPDDDDKFEALCQFNDVMLDKIGNSLDEAAGLKKQDAELVLATVNLEKSTTNVSSWNRFSQKKKFEYHLLSANQIIRPQARFKDKIDNSNSPFIPKITDKPNSIKPLVILPEIDDKGDESYSHPYEMEIEKFEPNNYFLQSASPKIPQPVDENEIKFIDTKQELLSLVEHLKNFKEIAVDLEHHSYRTFQGFTCLMQISTRKDDYLIDTLELRNEMHIFNEIFTSPSILKVFHGAEMDIQWLQRDFGIYLVNLFDTGQAAKLLGFSHLSLAFLLKHYCNVLTDKKFQLADWRLRPLAKEMVKYAAEDTHYLLYIYDRMKNELIAKGNVNKNLLTSLFDRCKQICLRKYEKSIFTNESYKTLLRKGKMNFNLRQEYALSELYSWRDKIARREDESIGYVLPNHMMIKIAEVLPREQQGILACCNPVPTLVKQQLNEIHLMILKARELPINKDSSVQVQNISLSNIHIKTLDFDDHVLSRHDIVHLENEHNLPTLLDSGYKHDFGQKMHILNPSLTFQMFSRKNAFLKKSAIINEIISNFICPFKRYKIAKTELIKAQEESKTIANSEENVSRVFSHLAEIAKESNKEAKEEDEVEIIEVVEGGEKTERKNDKGKRRRKATPDIPCNSIASVKFQQEQRNKEMRIEPYDYQSFDYSKFMSTSKPSNSSHPFNLEKQKSSKRKNSAKN